MDNRNKYIRCQPRFNDFQSFCVPSVVFRHFLNYTYITKFLICIIFLFSAQCALLGTMTSTPHKNQNSKSWIETLELLDPAGDLRNYKASIDLNLSSPCLKNNSLNISSTQGCAYILNNNQVAFKK